MPFEIVRSDIITMQVDAIVNAANPELRMGGGVCGAIFEAAGPQALKAECEAIGGCLTGSAVLTGGYNLPAKHIIHAVGPVWQGGSKGEEALLRQCYTSALELALEQGLTSIAFPLISSGIYGYPKGEALRIAVAAIEAFLREHDMEVYLVVFDRDSFDIGESRFRSIQSFIDDRYVETHTRPRFARLTAPFQRARDREETLPAAEEAALMEESLEDVSFPAQAPTAAKEQKISRSLDDVVSQLDESFSTMLLRLIDERGKTDVEVYKRANLDRKLFSKIRGNPGYQPRKSTAIAFAIALELSLDETRDLLSRAGYALSHSSKFDIIVEYFITEGIYNIFEINEALFAFEQPLLGA